MSYHCSEAAAPERGDTLRIALVGNPNAGKSTLFNALTGMRTKVANYPGVTVARHVGTAPLPDGGTLEIEDLPGTFSLDPISPDEQVVLTSLSSTDRADALIAVIDATQLRRGLGLIAQLHATELPILVALTHLDDLTRRGGSINTSALEHALGLAVIPVTSGHRAELAALRSRLTNPHEWPNTPVGPPHSPEDVSAWITSVLTQARFRAAGEDARTARIDGILLHPLWGTLAFFGTMFALFQLIFTVAAPFQDAIESAFVLASDLVRSSVGIEWLAGLLADGIIGGVGAVLVFVPQITLLFLALSLLESSGYMARAAFLMDRVMALAGLEGRAFVSMLSGLACAVPGIMATRSLPSARDRLATMMSVPLMTCSARLPVYTMLIALLVPDTRTLWGLVSVQGLVLFALYLVGAIAAMGSAWLFSRIIGRGHTPLPFTMELPTYQRPTVRALLLNTWVPVRAFLMKVGRIILALTVVLWALLNLPAASPGDLAAAGIDPNDSTAATTYQLEHSLAAALGHTVQPLFEPLGFDWRITVGVLASLGAREVFVSTLGQIASASDPENPLDALAAMTWGPGPHAGEPLFTAGTVAALLVFFIFALQCTSTIAALHRESGSWRWPAIAFFYMFALAWLSALAAKLLVGALW